LRDACPSRFSRRTSSADFASLSPCRCGTFAFLCTSRTFFCMLYLSALPGTVFRLCQVENNGNNVSLSSSTKHAEFCLSSTIPPIPSWPVYWSWPSCAAASRSTMRNPEAFPPSVDGPCVMTHLAARSADTLRVTLILHFDGFNCSMYSVIYHVKTSGSDTPAA
jgi:hypothetical protein